MSALLYEILPAKGRYRNMLTVRVFTNRITPSRKIIIVKIRGIFDLG